MDPMDCIAEKRRKLSEGATMDVDSLKSNIQQQLSEIEMLDAMFSNPREFRMEDLTAISEYTAFLEDLPNNIPPYIDITINLDVDNTKFEISINLPHEYPSKLEPEVLIRNSKLNRIEHAKLNKDLNELLPKWLGEPCIFSIISWLQENGLKYLNTQDQREIQKPSNKSEKMVRYWIYSHHIYSKTKKKEISSLAGDLNITGFCMVGKPGIICVEGCVEDCNDWWSQIKSMNWKKIFCKVTEDCSSRKFEVFEEVAFPNRGVRANHTDMSQFYKFLDENHCAYIFKELFGFDKSAIRDDIDFE